jgi:hypothetical protein
MQWGVVQLAELLVDAVTDGGDDVASVALARLAALDPDRWLRLDERCRGRSVGTWSDGPGFTPLVRIADWRLRAGTGLLPAVVASMHADGFVREVAVAELAAHRGPVASAALAVRTADWVQPVAGAAARALADRRGPAEAGAAVPVALHLTRLRRRGGAAQDYLAAVAAGPVETLAAVLASPAQRAARLWALDRLVARGHPAPDDAAALADRDPDAVVALHCARHVLAADAATWAPRLMASRRAGVRAAALAVLPGERLDRDTLRPLLVDRSGAVRSTARWRWRQAWGSPAPELVAVLDAPATARVTVAALDGLDEASSGDVALGRAIRLLGHERPAVRRAAARVVGRRGSLDEVMDRLPPLLTDPSTAVAKEAERCLARHGAAVSLPVLAELDRAGTTRARRAAFRLRRRRGRWDRVLADLRAVNGDDPELADTARADLLTWLRLDAATAYEPPRGEAGAEIAALVRTAPIDDEIRRRLATVIGIREAGPGR